MDILDDMGESKLSAKVYLKVNYSFKLILLGYEILDNSFDSITKHHKMAIGCAICKIRYFIPRVSIIYI